jgi:hypothetical protein
MQCWQFNTDAVSLPSILSWSIATAHVDRMLFTMHLSLGKGKKRSPPAGVERNVQKIFGEFIVATFWASAWPGTKLIGHKGKVWVIRFDEEVKELVLRTQPQLSRWHNNESLPEDLCVFREGSRYPALISVTHEKDAWLISAPDPRIPSTRKTKIPPSELIFDGKFFCKEWPNNK